MNEIFFPIFIVSLPFFGFFVLMAFDMHTNKKESATVSNHNAALKRVFDEAVLRGYITTVQVPQLENWGGASSERRQQYLPIFG